jgi:Protein of unknown function (DUF3352)
VGVLRPDFRQLVGPTRRPSLRGRPPQQPPPPPQPPPTYPWAPRPSEPPPRPTPETPEHHLIPEDLRFRLVTRFRAIGYWLREKGQIVGRGAGAVTGWWARRSDSTKNRIFAVAGVVAVYLVVVYLPVPGVPCEISATKECAPSNDTIAFVPKDASLYAHVTVKGDSHQAELAEDLADELPNFAGAIAADATALASPAGKPIDITNGVLPWAKDDLALFEIPLPKRASAAAYIVGVDDEDRANQFIASIAPEQPKPAKQNGVALNVYPAAFATATAGDLLIFGSEAAVRAALDARSGKAPRLEDSPPDAARDDLPDVRLAELYLSRAGIDRLLVGRAGLASQLDTFVDYGATTGMAASATIHDDGVEIQLISELDPKLEKASPTVFADLPEFKPGLADEAGTRAFGFVSVGDLGPALGQALETAGPGAQGLAGSLRALAQRLKQEAGVDPLKDLLPALGGQAALVAEPTDAFPYASLIVDDVDEEKANAVLASLQGPLLRAVGTAGTQVPTFQTTEIDGVTVHSLQISPVINLSYATFPAGLVISTQPEGVAQVLEDHDPLSGTDAYKNATEDLPERVSALVFLNLDEIFGLAPVRESLAVNPVYGSLSEDITHIESLGVGVRGSDTELRSEMFLAIND